MTRLGRSPSAATPTPLEWTPELIRRFWAYEARFPQNYYSYKYGQQILDRATELIGLDPRMAAEAVWLDYGCGYGSFTELLLRRGYRVVIHDLSEESLAACASRVSGQPGFLGPLDDYDGPIDAVSLIEVVEHVTPDLLAAIVDDLRRAGAGGAWLVATTPNDEDLEASMVYCPSCDTVRHRWQHLRRFTVDSLAGELSRLGLDDVRVREANFRRDLRMAAKNPLRKLKRLLCERASRGQRPNLLAAGRI